MNCSFLHSSVSLQRLAGFAGRFYDFPNDIGPLFHRASSQSIKGIHTLKETNHKPPQNNRETTGKYQRSGRRVLHSGKKSGWPESSGGLGVTSSWSGERLHWYCSRTANSTTAHVSGSRISSWCSRSKPELRLGMSWGLAFDIVLLRTRLQAPCTLSREAITNSGQSGFWCA